MATPGKAVVRLSGKRGVKPSGRAAVFNSKGECPECCCVARVKAGDLSDPDHHCPPVSSP